ncbi:MAG: hypothetical protein JW723_11765 [Bacteroidales bacterium]|nr:hypothetical protein [Bacteroidales bacterium]
MVGALPLSTRKQLPVFVRLQLKFELDMAGSALSVKERYKFSKVQLFKVPPDR